jgi:hypothetical protein
VRAGGYARACVLSSAVYCYCYLCLSMPCLPMRVCAVCVCVCVFVGGGGRVLQVLPVIPVRESHRASVSSQFYGASSGNSNNVKQSYLPNL